MTNRKKNIISLCSVFLLVIVVLTVILVVRHNSEQQEIAEREFEKKEMLYLMLTGTRVSPLIRNPDYELFADGTFERPDVVINFAGLRSIGFSKEEVFEVWMDEENPRREEMRKFFRPLRQVDGAPSTYSIRSDLIGVYVRYVVELREKFPEFELRDVSVPEGLPLTVLEEIINIWEFENVGSSNE
jgi:hypothetical protein